VKSKEVLVRRSQPVGCFLSHYPGQLLFNASPTASEESDRCQINLSSTYPQIPQRSRSLPKSCCC